MAKGGSRARSGPAADPTSARSEKRGGGAVTLTALPAAGWTGRAPAFPLPKISRGVDGEGRPNRAASDAFRKREMEIWRAVWKTPQAAAWSLDPWRWPTVGEYCRIKVAVELDPDSNAALLSRLREYRNEIGLTPDGLKINGWAISRDEVTPLAAKKAAAKTTEKAPPTRRLRSVGGDASS